MKRLLRNTRRSMLPGDVVRVQSFQEISLTLDEDGCCEGLPFMPEMLEFCGQSFTVVQRVDKVCVHGQQSRKMVGALVLDAPRCDGSSHDGCEMSCPYLWKEQWLARAGSTDHVDQIVGFIPEVPGVLRVKAKDGSHFCQSTALKRATSGDLPWWDLFQYFTDLRSKTFTLGEFPQVFWKLALSRFEKHRIRRRRIFPASRLAHSASELGLQVGELVEVKTYPEILATLDNTGKHKGLSFTMDMIDYCGGRYRVAAIPTRFISETEGSMRALRSTVYLEGLDCQKHRGCGRRLPLMWREAWLRRVVVQ